MFDDDPLIASLQAARKRPVVINYDVTAPKPSALARIAFTIDVLLAVFVGGVAIALWEVVLPVLGLLSLFNRGG